MIYNFANQSAGGGAPRGFISMNFGGGGEGAPPATDETSGLGGTDLTIETGITRGVGLSQVSGLTKRVD